MSRSAGKEGQSAGSSRRKGDNENEQDRQDRELLWKNLPGEQDRKATMGCLAAVMNIMYSYEHKVPEGSLSASTSNDAIKQDDKAQKDQSEESRQPSFVLREDSNDAPSSNSSLRRFSSRRASEDEPSRRKEEFQRELLRMSTDLLFLPPETAAVFVPNLGIQCASDDEQELLLDPFLRSISSAEAAFRCVALLLFRFLLLSSNSSDTDRQGVNNDVVGATTIVGYDARVRYAFKYLAVSMLSYWEQLQGRQHSTERGQEETRDSVLLASDAIRLQSIKVHATRKFEALEDGIAERLAMISRWIEKQKDDADKSKPSLTGQRGRKSIGQHVVRGLKIGTAGVAAGTLFAITGGLAAPAIAAGIATVTGAGFAASAAITLLTFPAATTIFGLGGGSLVASKMSKRTKGLHEFEIKKVTPESSDENKSGTRRGRDASTSSAVSSSSPELSRTVCISGWLTDEHDFQRPFGMTPDTLTDKHELLCRFCSVYAPHVLPKCRKLLQEWKGKEDELWEMLSSSYGKDPDSLLPLSGPRQDAALSDSENDAVDDLVRTMGFPMPTLQEDASTSSQRDSLMARLPPPVNLLSDVLTTNGDKSAAKSAAINETTLRSYKAWDFHAQYGGEQYIVRWEKDLLLQLNGTAKEFTTDLAKSAAGEVLKKTALASLMAATFLPSTLLSLSNVIDEKWTLAAERADEAGVVLAQSLLVSDAGHRPVSLIGFSFGARIIVSCLQELARHQQKWEEQQWQVKDEGVGSNKAASRRNVSKKESLYYEREPASIVEDVVLMGCPASVNPSSWAACRRVVAGRLINCYSKNDLMLTLMYRIKNMRSILSPPVGILEDVKISGVENWDVSCCVASHGEYCVAVKDILEMVGHDQPAQVASKEIQAEARLNDEVDKG